MDSTEKLHSNYRADIDGLRAVAVLSVVAYHLPIFRFRGGFVGVDVFFVISGYLITSRIRTDLAGDRFSLAAFYERRVRRIFPALIGTLVGVCLVAPLCMMPAELVLVAKSLVAATLSISNVLFWTQAGYFDGPSAAKPLLHTWSLAIEEQFYVVFPLFLAWLYRRSPKRLPAVLFAVTFASFMLSALGAFKYPSSTFYLAHTRAWELLLGALVALKLVPKISGALARNIATSLGLVAILIPVLTYTDGTPFPGLAALPPCAGAALIILAGETGPSLVSRMLSLRPVVFVGLISYSLYLWHWPVIVFQGFFPAFISSHVVRVKVLVLVTSFAISILSYKFVESPFRSGALRQLSRARLFATAGAAAALLCVLGFATVGAKGFPSRFSDEAVQVASYLTRSEPFETDKCFLNPPQTFADFNPAICLRRDETKKNYILIGDSHAADLWYGFTTTFSDANVMHATSSGCRPTAGEHDPGERQCRDLMNFVYHDYLKKNSVDAVWVAGRWTPTDLPKLAETVAWAKDHGIRMVLLGPVPQYDAPLPRLLASALIAHDPAMTRQHLLPQIPVLDARMMKAASSWGIGYVSLISALCDGKACVEYAAPGVPLQMDYGHVTADGSLFVARALAGQLLTN